MVSMDWDDLRYFLAIARAGSLSGGARTLAVNHSTMFRRLGTFEETLGVRLFDRSRDGYSLTEAGADLLATAERVEEEIEAGGRRVTGQDLRLSGPLAVTTTNTLAVCLLAPLFKEFNAAYPGIDLTLLLDAQFFNLSKRQADVAIRPTIQPPDHLVGRRVAPVSFAVYGGQDYLKEMGAGQDLTELDWVLPDDSLAHLAAAKWLAQTVPPDKVSVRSNNLFGLMSLAAAGQGVALLPCFMGDTNPELARVTDPIRDAQSELWLLTHPDLRKTQRVRRFMEIAGDWLVARRPILDGSGLA